MKFGRSKIALALGLLAGLWGGSGCAKAPAPGPAPVAEVKQSAQTPAQLAMECGLGEPLVELGGGLASQERDSLEKALRAYQQHSRDQKFSGDPLAELAAFRQQFPQSSVRGSLDLNLGLLYRVHGYNRRSLDALRSAWESLKSSPDLQASDLANRALGEYCLTLGYLGRLEDLKRALGEAKGRKLHGSSTELIAGATEALELMQKHPENSFRCGPLALAKLASGYAFVDKQDTQRACGAIDQCKSTRKGTSLAQVYKLSQTCKMSYQMAFRSPGAPLITHAVMHWKAGHFGALLDKKGERYLVEDSTSITSALYVSADCLNQEASGYFLVPAGRLPQGWRSVGLSEAQTVWGCGVTPEKDPDATSIDDKLAFEECSASSAFMPTWNIHALLVGLTLRDTPVGLSPAQFALPFQVNYAQREANQPTVFTYSNLGNKWNFNYLSYVNDTFYALGGRVTVFLPGGGQETYQFYTNTQSLMGGVTNTLLDRVEGVSYTVGFRDGTKRIYDKIVGTKYFLTKIIDPQGNTVQINYDSQNRVVSVVDSSNRVMTLTYGLASDPLKITKVTDPFGRSANFAYTNGQLTSITDVLGLTSSFQYGANDFIQAMTTPYGTTRFDYADKSTDPTLNERRILTAVDPQGRNYRAEFRNETPGIPFSETAVPQGMPTLNQYLDSRNSFSWTPNQLAGGTIDYTKATITHFLHNRYNIQVAGRTVESIKKPNDRRIWFFYLGQVGGGFFGPGFEAIGSTTIPAAIGRVHSDGSTQLTQFGFNAQSNPTIIIDPTGRIFNLSYAPNGIDLTAVVTGGKTLMSATYDTHHNIVSLTNASGGTSTMAYDSKGLLQSLVNPLGETTTYGRTPTGNIASIQEPLSKTTTFSYDSAERMASATDSEGYTAQVTYDAGDRPTQVTYPDGTNDQLTYSRLDVVQTKDRLGRITQMSRDSLGRLLALTDANGGVTSLGYGLEDGPNSLTDPNGNQTQFQYDLQQRMVAKQLPGGATQSVIYEQCFGRVYSVTDELGRSKTFSYFLDDNVKSITYSGNTPAVNFTEDSFLPRPLSMTDGTGTTSFTYGDVGAAGANQVKTVTGPYGDQAQFSYDVAGRPVAQTVNGSAENVTYDALWRPTATTNALDTFNMEYLGKTGQVTGVNSTAGPSMAYTYGTNAQDRRLSQIKNLGRTGTALSQFDYQYDAIGQITQLTETIGTATNSTGGGGDDDCHDKCCHKGKCCKKNKCCKRKCCKGRGDCGKERCHQRHDRDDDDDDGWGMAAPFDLRLLNGLLGLGIASLWGGLLWQFARRPRTTTSRLAQVTSLALVSALALNGCIFSGGGTTTTNTRTLGFSYDKLGELIGVSLNGTSQEGYTFDKSGNLTGLTTGGVTSSFSYNSLNQQTSPAGQVFDAKGQTTTTNGRTYEWDDQGRITAIVMGTQRTELSYDGMSRRTKITEFTNGTVTSKKLYFWLGGSIVCERDGLQTGFPITKRFFTEGLVQGTTKLYYCTDHLGSVRELVDSTGAVRAEYSYSTYGEQTKVSGDLEADWGYAGLWHHAASGLDLATYRAYDAANKRWISRDPLGEGIDYNLYRYCGNSPVMLNDPEGLQPPEFDDGGYSGARDSFRNAVHNGVQTVETTGRRAGEFGIDMVGDPTDPTTWWTFFVSEEKLMWKVEQALLKWKKKLNRAKKCTDALNTVEGAQDQLESIQHAQNKLRKGKASGIVIDSIQKSTDRLRNSLKNRYQR